LTRTRDAQSGRIDAMMDKASRALVERRYFEAERIAAEALEAANLAGDYSRMARILLPLQEARRLKRQMAADAHAFFVIDDQLPKPAKLAAGCYLIKPPRVGLDARMLRELADRRETPAIIICREPTTRLGQWPIVALGPVTVRTKVDPPVVAAPTASAKGRKGSKRSAAVEPSVEGQDPLPDLRWFLEANEALGDAAIATLDPARGLASQIETLYNCLAAHPDHEKLHQRLAQACEEAARLGIESRRDRIDALGEFDDGVGGGGPEGLSGDGAAAALRAEADDEAID